MAVTPIPDAPVVPQYPALGSATFNQEAYAYGTAMPNVTQRIHEIAQAARSNAVESGAQAVVATEQATLAAGQVTLATVQATHAHASAQRAASAANFKGPWVNLSGPLNMPASVSHNGRDWRLNNDVANVALEEPGVSPAWSGMVTVDVTMEVSTDTTLIPGVYYIVTTPGITLSIPDTVYLGERYSVSNVSDDKIYIDWKSYTVKGKVPDLNMAIPKRAGFSVIYSGSTFA